MEDKLFEVQYQGEWPMEFWERVDYYIELELRIREIIDSVGWSREIPYLKQLQRGLEDYREVRSAAIRRLDSEYSVPK
jgi:hypothetical protein